MSKLGKAVDHYLAPSRSSASLGFKLGRTGDPPATVPRIHGGQATNHFCITTSLALEFATEASGVRSKNQVPIGPLL